MAQPATDFQQLLEQLAALTAALTTHNAQPAPTINAQVMVPAHVTQGNQKKDTVQKPQTFDGSHDQMRSFLAGFQIWAAAQEEAMNTYETGQGYVRDDRVWIITALSFMKGAASVWATNYQANYNEGKPTFDNKWDTFVTEFRQNSEAQDEKQYAQACLDNLWQKGQMVEQYTAKFRLYTPHTCDDGSHQFFTLTQTGSVDVPLLQPVNGTFNGYKHVTHLEGDGYNL
jgi:hypothetical protein